jgi:hypothetical protein
MEETAMKPKNIHDALRHLHNHTLCIANDLTAYMDSPGEYSPEFFEDVRDAALDAHLLVTWIKDNLKGEVK